MKGKISVVVRNNRLQYKFEIKRNITVLKGDSATGKTTLIEMIAAYERDGEKSGISVQCEKKCFTLAGSFWRENLKHIKNALVFIDEGNLFLYTKEFATAIKNSDNYYIIATREPLKMLPYSVDEVYGIVNKTRGYGNIKRLYSEFDHIYQKDELNLKVDVVIVEDANAGHEFFKEYFEEKGVECITAKGKSNICKKLLEIPKSKYVLIIADGAAFGPEMEDVLRLKYTKRICLFLPESFEWIILKSGIVEIDNRILDTPEEFVESKDFFSWERFFNHVLSELTRGSYLEYTKKKLNANYLQESIKTKIVERLPNM